MAGYSMLVSPEQMLNKKLKIQNMNKRTTKKFQPEEKLNNEQKADEKQVTPAIANALVIGSQSPQEFTVWNLLDTICDGLIGFKASGKELYKVKTTLELPTESYNRFCDFLKMRCPDAFNETEILYAGFKFCVKELS